MVSTLQPYLLIQLYLALLVGDCLAINLNQTKSDSIQQLSFTSNGLGNTFFTYNSSLQTYL